MPDGGTLTIRARRHGGPINGRGGTYVVIDLIDTGTGMSDEVQARAFEPFFTTKDIGRGSGLGLSQAYGFAKQSGGMLTVESAPGKGSKVSLHLPKAEDGASRLSFQQPTVRPRQGNGCATVLLVEDDTGVAELALGMLQDAGYKVKTAANAADALKVLREGGHIDLVFSDIMMPGGMNGAELARVVRGEFPSIFILLTTGYAEAAAQATREFPLIRKPYGREVLLDKVGEILGEAG
jgi:CheY-like chemotaxis protein